MKAFRKIDAQLQAQKELKAQLKAESKEFQAQIADLNNMFDVLNSKLEAQEHTTQ